VIHPFERGEVGGIGGHQRTVRREDGEAVADRLHGIPEAALGDLHRALRAFQVVADRAAFLAERLRLLPLDGELVSEEAGVGGDLLVGFRKLGLAAFEGPLCREPGAPFDRQAALMVTHSLLRHGILAAETGGSR
jgi:hypothetical protein